VAQEVNLAAAFRRTAGACPAEPQLLFPPIASFYVTEASKLALQAKKR